MGKYFHPYHLILILIAVPGLGATAVAAMRGRRARKRGSE